MQKFYFAVLLTSTFLFFSLSSSAQGVMNPADSVYTYNPSAPPAQPTFGQIGKWVRTVDLSWNTNEYKAYIYKGCAFRLHFPKSYNPTANDGKKYPILVFFHGAGEAGPITDNELQLYHGGQPFQTAVDNGTFDGYVFFMQSQGLWGGSQYQYITELMDSLTADNKLDPFRIYVDGLSAGGQGAWELMLGYPRYVTCNLPISFVSIGYDDSATVNQVKFTPMWNFNGGLDGSPAPSTVQQVYQAMQAAGADYTNTEFITQGHDAWDSAWLMPNFWPFMLATYSSNPWTLYGRTSFCPGSPINVTIGVTPGYDAYQWEMNGTLIPGAVTNSINATQVGTYSARVERKGVWSDWSHTPVNITIQTPTVTPPIQVSGLMSTAIPAPDGNTSVNLTVPNNNYVSYTWESAGSNTVLGTQQVFNATQPGYYIVSVNQLYGCSSNFSPAFKVINAKGPNPPAAVTSLVATPLSYTKIQLAWTPDPKPVYAPFAYEVYRAKSATGAYTFAGQVASPAAAFIDSNLTPNVKYFYTVRAIDSTAASALCTQASATTLSDKIPPTIPGNLKLIYTSPTTITIGWNSSADNVSVNHYAIFVNGVQSNATPDTTFILTGLTPSQSYAIYVEAVDGSNNFSAPSNQLVAQTILSGLQYSYYTTPTQWSVLPNFSSLTPVTTGVMPNVSIASASQTTNFGYLWQGYIRITVAGTYTFETTSDDGSDLWFNSYTPTGTPLVNNDGLHGSQSATGKVTLQPGVYPICIEYFQGGGGYAMSVSWSCTQLYGNSNFVAIPNTAFNDTYTPAGTVPAQPTGLKATASTYNKIALTWVDNSNNETAFEVYRSTSATGPFAIINRTAANVTSYSDSGSLNPSTTYYYQVQAINNYGGSGFNDTSTTSGLTYSYYVGTWTATPNFAALTAKSTGTLSNISITSGSGSGYGFLFQGQINIPTTGSYTFYTTSDNGSSLYIGGYTSSNLVVNNVFNKTAAQASGTISLTAGVYPIYVAYYYNKSGNSGSASLSVSYAGPGITKQTIPNSAFVVKTAIPIPSATTLALPAAPKAPTAFTATTVSSSKINLAWTDNDASITGYQINRSIVDSLHFGLLATLPAGAVSYTDSSLFGNSVYYYRVIAVNPGGTSQSAAKTAKTTANPPHIVKLGTQYALYGTTTYIAESATDADGETLKFSVKNNPSFTSLVDSGDGHATLVINNPTAANQGTYSNIQIIVNNGVSQYDTSTFNLVVNNILQPSINAISNVNMNENDTLTLNLAAVDPNTTDTLVWSVSGLPNNYTLTHGTNSAAQLFLHPTYAAAGTYNVSVSVNDGKGGTATQQFTLTVNYKNPNTNVYVRFMNQDAAPAPWNSVTGVTSNNFTDASGNATTIGLALQTTWFATYNNGPVTGNNSGVYPDPVLEDYYYFGIFGGPSTVTAQVTGLDTTKLYNLTFYGGSVWPGASNNGSTIYTVGSQSDTLNVQGNTQNTVSVNTIKPASGGIITFTMSVTPGTPVGYINALVITSLYNDGTVPIAPNSLTAQNGSGQAVQLSWVDAAYNATGYNVYRSLNAAGPFTLVGTAQSTAVSYTDTSGTGTTQYYYEVDAVNTAGASAFSNIAGIVTGDRVPSIAPVSNIILTSSQTATVTVSAKDDSTDHLTLTAANLPPFATFTDNGNGTGTIAVNPANGNIGIYQNVTVTATDNSDSSRSTTFSITVKDPNVQSVYLDFSTGTLAAPPAPWNRLAGWPFAGTMFNNLVDDGNNPSNITVTFKNGFAGVVSSGMQPVNGLGIYPNTVLRDGEYESGSNTDSIVIGGLSTSLKYSFVFFNSHDDGLSSLTDFTINGQTVALNGTDNLTKTIAINGITPSAAGTVTIGVAKDPSATYAIISALVIQAYSTTQTVFAPTNLLVTGTTRTTASIQWQDRSASETGYQVWRATGSTGSYSLLATLAAGSTSYTDVNLTKNTTYYYAVRTVYAGSTYSGYSNPVAATTCAYAVYVNYTQSNNAGLPWNNTDVVPQSGYTWSNFFDETGVPTSTGMEVTDNWAGLYTAGMNPGNNSGIYPDTVMIDSYGLFPGQTGTLQIQGLNFGMKYNLTFFGSSQAYGDVNVAYTVNGVTTILNTSLNVNGTETIYGVTPDNNGNISISVTAADINSQFGLLGTLVLQSYTPSTAPAPQPPQPVGGAQTAGNRKPAVSIPAAPATAVAAVATATSVSAYPNPFSSYISLTVPSKTDNETVSVNIYTIEGQLVYSNSFGNITEGNNSIKINTTENMAAAGLYSVNIIYENQKIHKTIILVKQ